jgi:hypothetical protein
MRVTATGRADNLAETLSQVVIEAVIGATFAGATARRGMHRYPPTALWSSAAANIATTIVGSDTCVEIAGNHGVIS